MVWTIGSAVLAGWDSKVRFFLTTVLVNQHLVAKKGDTLQKYLKNLEKADFIICDECGYFPLDRDDYERQSIDLMANLECSRLATIFHDEQVTTPMIDQLLHYSHLLVFDEESWRMKNSLIRQ